MDTLSSDVTIRPQMVKKSVPITSASKPDIIESVIRKWQNLLDITAQVVGVPSGLIMKLNTETIEVFAKSNTVGNPYEVGEEAKLIYGLYCETVIGNQKKLLVPNAKTNKFWKDNNPDVDIDMIAYLGYPINWPDNEVFGTVCLLDNKENNFTSLYEQLLFNVKVDIENDLKLLVQNLELEHLNHIKSRFLSLISHDIRSSLGSQDLLLKTVLPSIENFSTHDLSSILSTISQSTSEIYLTLENLLNWSKADLLHLEAEKQDVNLVDVLGKVMQYFNHAINYKQIRLKVAFEQKEHIVYVDKNMVETAFRNIFSNALKYSEKEGEIVLSIKNVNNSIVVDITDHGIGMTKETVDSLFVYDKLHASEGTSGESSAGIGLLLCNDFLNKNNATVSVTSTVGKGTTFSVTF